MQKSLSFSNLLPLCQQISLNTQHMTSVRKMGFYYKILVMKRFSITYDGIFQTAVIAFADLVKHIVLLHGSKLDILPP